MGSHFLLQGIFLIQGSKLNLMYWQMYLQRLSLILLTACFIDSGQVGGSKQKQEKKVVEGMEKIEEKYKVGKQKKQNPPASSFIPQAFKLGPCTS